MRRCDVAAGIPRAPRPCTALGSSLRACVPTRPTVAVRCADTPQTSAPQPQYGGWCPRCRTTHSLAPDAQDLHAAAQLREQLDSHKRFDYEVRDTQIVHHTKARTARGQPQCSIPTACINQHQHLTAPREVQDILTSTEDVGCRVCVCVLCAVLRCLPSWPIAIEARGYIHHLPRVSMCPARCLQVPAELADPAFSTDYVWTKGPGRMLGVMIARPADSAENSDTPVLVLKAFRSVHTPTPTHIRPFAHKLWSCTELSHAAAR